MHPGSHPLPIAVRDERAARTWLHHRRVRSQHRTPSIIGDRDAGNQPTGRVQDRQVGVVARQARHVGKVEVGACLRRTQHIGAATDPFEAAEVDRSLGHHPTTTAGIGHAHDGRDPLVGGCVGRLVQIGVDQLGEARIGRDGEQFGSGRTGCRSVQLEENDDQRHRRRHDGYDGVEDDIDVDAHDVDRQH